MARDDDPRPRSRTGAAGPSGDGWNDGGASHGRTRAEPRSGRRPRTGGARSDAGPKGKKKPLPRWIPIAAVVGVLLLVIVVVVATRGGSDASDAGPCLTELATHLPEKGSIVYGTDLVQARSAGYDDSDSLEKLGASQQDTGTLPDPLTGQVRFGRLVSVDDFTGQTGVAPGDITCALSNGETGVLSGSFDAAEIRGSALGSEDRIVASGDVLVVGDSQGAPATATKAPRKLLEVQDPSLADDDDVAAVLGSLREGGAYSLLAQRGSAKGKIRVAGIGVGGTDETRQALVAWQFDKDSDAEAGKREVVERVNDALRGIASIDTTDLTVDGTLVSAAIDVRKAPDLQRLLLAPAPLIRSGS